MSEGEQPPAAPEAGADRIARAAAIYFAIVFAVGLVLGPARVAWLEPWLGETIAVLCEVPFLLTAMTIAAWLAPRWAGLRDGWATYLAVGLIAFALQQIADLAVGFGLRGTTLNEQLAYFATPPGYIYAATLVAFVLMPLIVRLRRSKNEEA